MQRKLVLEFTKMSGAGNDFIVIDNRFYYFSDEELQALAQRFCARRTGIGADGILALNAPHDPTNHYRMRYVNADGSMGTMCGNGARCLARYARMAGIQAEELVFESDAGRALARVPVDPAGPVRIYFAPAQHYKPDVALQSPAHHDLAPVHAIWTGTEHAVQFVDDVATTPLETLGPTLRRDGAFQPTGANIDFVEVVADGAADGMAHLRLRTFEKGVEAETLACGTGAMAATLVAYYQNQIRVPRAEVEVPGGRLAVGFQANGDFETSELYLEGPAEVIYRGTVEI